MDVIRGIVGKTFAILIVSHRRLEVLVSQMRLNLLWLGASLDGESAACMSEHVRCDVARQASSPGIPADDRVDRLISDRFTVRLIA